MLGVIGFIASLKYFCIYSVHYSFCAGCNLVSSDVDSRLGLVADSTPIGVDWSPEISPSSRCCPPLIRHCILALETASIYRHCVNGFHYLRYLSNPLSFAEMSKTHVSMPKQLDMKCDKFLFSWFPKVQNVLDYSCDDWTDWRFLACIIPNPAFILKVINVVE